MKFATFRGLVIGGGAILGVGGLIGACALCVRDDPGSSRPPAAPTANAVATVPTQAAPSPIRPSTGSGGATTPAPSGNLRPMDQAILQRIAQNIPGDKVKDAFPGQTYKVNLFKDAGESGVNRLKIDLDRDEKWDEKWTITNEGGRQEIKRQVAPADDESYTEDYRLRDGSWVKK